MVAPTLKVVAEGELVHFVTSDGRSVQIEPPAGAAAGDEFKLATSRADRRAARNAKT